MTQDAKFSFEPTLQQRQFTHEPDADYRPFTTIHQRYAGKTQLMFELHRRAVQQTIADWVNGELCKRLKPWRRWLIRHLPTWRILTWGTHLSVYTHVLPLQPGDLLRVRYAIMHHDRIVTSCTFISHLDQQLNLLTLTTEPGA
jgi:hypothetical protein